MLPLLAKPAKLILSPVRPQVTRPGNATPDNSQRCSQRNLSSRGFRQGLLSQKQAVNHVRQCFALVHSSSQRIHLPLWCACSLRRTARLERLRAACRTWADRA